MTANVPEAISNMIAATNAADSRAFLDCFAPNAFLSDWGRSYQGRAEIAKWDKTDNIGVESRMRIVGIEKSADVYQLRIAVQGKGFNGEGKMAISLAENQITKLIVS
jgi:hypothetical protein